MSLDLVTVLLAGIALLFILRGLYTIARCEGPVLGPGKKKYVARGKYAVLVGLGQVLIGLSFVPHLFDLAMGFTCSLSMILLLTGASVHYTGAFTDPGVRSRLEVDRGKRQARARDPDVVRKRKRGVAIRAIASIALGIGMASLVFFTSKSNLEDAPLLEQISLFLIACVVFSVIFFLASLKGILNDL